MRRYLLIWVGWSPLLGILHGFPSSPEAQDVVWDEPTRLHSSKNFVGKPLLLTDASTRVHLFWPEKVLRDGKASGTSVIYYSVEDGDEWSTPIDVLVVSSSVEEIRGHLDHHGVPSLILSGINSPLLYSRAKTSSPISTHDWERPVAISKSMIGGSIVGEPGGSLHIVSGDSQGDLWYFRMDDKLHVVDDKIIGSLPENQVVRHSPPFIIGKDGALHVIFPAVTLPFETVDTYYIHSKDAGKSWTSLEKVTVEGSDVWSIVEDNSGWLHALFIGSFGIGGRFHRLSADGGLSWSKERLVASPDHATGLSGGDLALDSAGHLHAVFGCRADKVIAHSVWNGSEWSPWTAINSDVTGAQEFMSLEVTYGNRLHVVWESDHDSIWYVEGRSAAPEENPGNQGRN